jgi:hypothetical protein
MNGCRKWPADVLKLANRTARGASDGLAHLGRLSGFLHGLLQFNSRPDDVFVVTYPRSGTTWMQMIVYQVLTDGKLQFDHISQVSPWFERSLANGQLSAAELNAWPGPRIFKSHLPVAWVPKSGRRIYIERDGRDVALSYYHLYRSQLGYTDSFEAFFDRFLRGRVQYGSWFKHVAAWRARRHETGLLYLRYEDLKTDLEHGVARVADHLGVSLTRKQMDRVLSRSSFEFMQQNESKFDHMTSLMLERGWRPRTFIRKGQPGEGRATLTDAQRAAFARTRPPPLPQVEWGIFDFLL